MAIGDGRGLVGLCGRELAKSLEAVGLGDLVAGHVGALGGDGAMASGAVTLLDADAAIVDEGGDEETAEGMTSRPSFLEASFMRALILLWPRGWLGENLALGHAFIGGADTAARSASTSAFFGELTRLDVLGLEATFLTYGLRGETAAAAFFGAAFFVAAFLSPVLVAAAAFFVFFWQQALSAWSE